MLPVCHFPVNAPTEQRRAEQVKIDHLRTLSQSLGLDHPLPFQDVGARRIVRGRIALCGRPHGWRIDRLSGMRGQPRDPFRPPRPVVRGRAIRRRAARSRRLRCRRRRGNGRSLPAGRTP
jgi:hypothetical protein